MQYFTLEADTPKQALEKMKEQFGTEARILTHKNVRRGGLFGFFAKEGVELTGYLPQNAAAGKLSVSVKADVEAAKKKILENAKREQAFQHILKEIQGLKETLKTPAIEYQDKPHTILEIEEILMRNEFSSDFIKQIEERIRHDFSLQDLDNSNVLHASVLEWIGENIKIHPPLNIAEKGNKIFIIIGPTGVGKTTTIAKLAAIYGVGKFPAPKVKIVTIDNYRIAARNQIETYAEIMRIPVSCVESTSDFKKVLALSDDSDLILVDTIGKSPRDFSKLAEMKEILDTAGSMSETHLAISATTKYSDIEDILKQFEPFRYNAVILTKLDETSRIGNVISVLSEMNKSISYIADGQSVPQDIERASIVRLLLNLEGFRSNRERLEVKFEKIEDRYWS